MKAPTDKIDEDAASEVYPGLELLGRFDPLEAKRLLERLEDQHLSFKVEGCSEIRPSLTRNWRRNWVNIYIRPKDKEKAEAIVIHGAQP